jgi:hypothetical protein
MLPGMTTRATLRVLAYRADLAAWLIGALLLLVVQIAGL